MSDIYPKQMRHPAEQPSRCIRPASGKFDAGEWSQASYMPVFVHNADQEEEYRAKGYRGPGEGAQPMLVFQEFPKMLHHPAYVPEVAQVIDAKMENGRVVTVTTPGRPAVNPPVTVHNEAEEADWVARGYGAPKAGDAAAFSMAVNSPHRPSGYEPQRYPMMVGDRLVRNETEEEAARGGVTGSAAVVAPAASAGPAVPTVAQVARQMDAPTDPALLARIAQLEAENAALKEGKAAATRAKRAAGLAKARQAKAEKKGADGESGAPAN